MRAFASLLAPGSSVVLISLAGGAYRAWPRHVAYVASKAAVAKAASPPSSSKGGKRRGAGRHG